ncbi:MAG: ribosome assembly RNA-binding protein YhbY [Hahellaceae bacterium]|nr:ribosome assembly RNA-binding protein YhbY [Hahellaceae bacterium]MCP5168754.1 ribosome assembly RNA-binding protein YhbY [Hahellaceae bacterium]
MPLTAAQKKQYRAIAHALNPVVIVSENGITDGVKAELERALNDHELIKVKIALTEREDRAALIAELVQETQSELIQVIGKIAIILRKAKQPNPKLSNLQRNSVSK